MRFIRMIFISILFLNLVGCASDFAKRLAYDAVQDMRDQACQENMGMECSQRQSYDQYQYQLKSAMLD